MKLPISELNERFSREEITFAVIQNGELVHARFARGIAPALELLTKQPHLLQNAAVCDTIVGKAAAALFILGGVKEVYAFTISEPAVAVLKAHGIVCHYETLCTQIINRRGDGLCPFEQAVLDVDTPKACLPVIEKTFQKLTAQ